MITPAFWPEFCSVKPSCPPLEERDEDAAVKGRATEHGIGGEPLSGISTCIQRSRAVKRGKGSRLGNFWDAVSCFREDYRYVLRYLGSHRKHRLGIPA